MLWTMLAILCAGCVSMPGLAATDPKYLDLSVERLHAGLQDGSLSCTDVVSTYLERIARLDKAADRRHSINAMRSINGDAHGCRFQKPRRHECPPVLRAHRGQGCL